MAGESGHRWPSFLPDGRHFLYQRSGLGVEKTGIYVGSLETPSDQQSSTPILRSDRQAYYLPGDPENEGWLVFQQESTILAQPFSATTFSLHGEAVPIAANVGAFPRAFSGLFSVSPTGALVYRTGETAVPVLQWFEPHTKTTSVAAQPGNYFGVSLSPNGTQAAVRQTDSKGNSDIWVFDLARKTSTRLTFDTGLDDNPIWTPDGKRVIFSASRGGPTDLYERNADGSGDERLVWQSGKGKTPTSVSPDGRYLLFQELDAGTNVDLWILPLADGAKPSVFQRTAGLDVSGIFSPDGRWIAYVSNESGTGEVYIRPFDSRNLAPNIGGKWMVSQQGGVLPRWRQDGRQIFYMTASSQLMAVDVEATTSVRLGIPTPLSAVGEYLPSPYGVTADGKRFLFAAVDASGPQSPFTVWLDWKSMLTRASAR